LYPEKTYGQEFGGPLNLAALCGRIGRILAKAGSGHEATSEMNGLR